MNQIGINNKQGATIAAEYIIKKGYHTIGYAMSNEWTRNFDDRYTAFSTQLQQHGVEIAPENVYKLSPNSLEVELNLKKKLANAVSLPQDIAIIGFDDNPESKIVTPELTTISIDKTNFAKLAIQQLIYSIENDISYQTLLNCQIIERASS